MPALVQALAQTEIPQAGADCGAPAHILSLKRFQAWGRSMGLALRVIAAASCSFGLTILVCAATIFATQFAPGFAFPPLIASEMHVIAPALMSITVCLSTALALWTALAVFPKERFHPAWCFAIGFSLVLGSLAVAAFTEYLNLVNPAFPLGLAALGGIALVAGLVSSVFYADNRILAGIVVGVIFALAAGAGYGAYHALTTPGGRFGPTVG